VKKEDLSTPTKSSTEKIGCEKRRPSYINQSIPIKKTRHQKKE